jgi:hypothetical protein
MEIRIFDTQPQLNQAFTDWLKEIARNKDCVNIALSGAQRQNRFSMSGR